MLETVEMGRKTGNSERRNKHNNMYPNGCHVTKIVLDQIFLSLHTILRLLFDTINTSTRCI